jgi:hypothetical protein
MADGRASSSNKRASSGTAASAKAASIEAALRTQLREHDGEIEHMRHGYEKDRMGLLERVASLTASLNMLVSTAATLSGEAREGRVAQKALASMAVQADAVAAAHAAECKRAETTDYLVANLVAKLGAARPAGRRHIFARLLTHIKQLKGGRKIKMELKEMVLDGCVVDDGSVSHLPPSIRVSTQTAPTLYILSNMML